MIRVHSPADGSFVGETAVHTRSEVEAAVARAREAQRHWAALSFRQRGAMLKRFRDALLDLKEEVALTITGETGKPEAEAYAVELFYVCDAIGFWAKHAQRYLADRAERPHLVKTKKAYSTYKPRGVIGIIAPWSFPFALTIGEAIPALMAGNAVVIKPSEVTPLSAVVGCGIAEQAGLPPGLLAAVCGYAETGADLIDFVDMVAFTGSTVTGRKIAVKCAEQLKPCTMELGGKDPMIVCRDADLERAANGAVWAAFTNSGQACVSVERIYVDEKIYEPFVSKVVAKARQVRQGLPDEDPDIGAMTFPPQVANVERHLSDAVAKGARILTGGGRPRRSGLWIEPTVVVDVDHSMELMTDETFGPVIAIQKVHDEAEAVRLANDSRYGLSASVWSKDKAGAINIARRIEAGAVCVNDHIIHMMMLEVPMGGTKQSGLGRRHGRDGITKFCEQQSIVVDRLGLAKEMFWYPSDRRRKKRVMRMLDLLFHSSWRKKLLG